MSLVSTLKNKLSQIVVHGEKYRKGKIEYDYMKEIMKVCASKYNWITYHIADIGLHNKFLDTFAITEEGVTLYIEFKKVEGFVFPLSKFREGQLVLLDELERRGSPSFIACYSQKTKTHIILTYSEYEKYILQDPDQSPRVFSKEGALILPRENANCSKS